MTDDVSRRRFVRTGLLAGGSIALAGCTAGDNQSGDAADGTDGESDTSGGPDFPEIENPPDAVYLPTHFESMRHLAPVDAGEFELMPMVTYPHRFWNITGDEVEPADPEGDDVHLMVAVRDPDTGIILPVETGLQLAVGLDGESKSSHAPWPMISQEMGFHFGDNIPLDGDGSYEVDVTVGGLDIERTGEFEDRFDEGATGTFSFEFDQAFREEVVGGIEYLDEADWGQPGALGPMGAMMGEMGEMNNESMDGGMDNESMDGDGGDAEMSGGGMSRDFGTYTREAGVTELPPVDSLPGELLGTPSSGDAVLATTLHDADSRFVAEGQYLSVSPRTPYNRGMLPLMSIDLTVDRAGEDEPVIDSQLTEALDHELGYHYTLRTAELEADVVIQDGDTITLSFPTPPQVSRHQGYETAFLDMEPVELTVSLP
jgi:hypothetical protein